MAYFRFQWDAGNWPKCSEHGVAKAQIEAIFAESNTYVGPDLEHSGIESRWIAVGVDPSSDRAIFVVFTVRVDRRGRIFRPISARFMHAKEVKRYVGDTH